MGLEVLAVLLMEQAESLPYLAQFPQRAVVVAGWGINIQMPKVLTEDQAAVAQDITPQLALAYPVKVMAAAAVMGLVVLAAAVVAVQVTQGQMLTIRAALAAKVVTALPLLYLERLPLTLAVVAAVLLVVLVLVALEAEALEALKLMEQREQQIQAVVVADAF